MQAAPPRPNGVISALFKAVVVAASVKKMVRDAGAAPYSDCGCVFCMQGTGGQASLRHLGGQLGDQVGRVADRSTVLLGRRVTILYYRKDVQQLLGRSCCRSDYP